MDNFERMTNDERHDLYLTGMVVESIGVVMEHAVKNLLEGEDFYNTLGGLLFNIGEKLKEGADKIEARTVEARYLGLKKTG